MTLTVASPILPRQFILCQANSKPDFFDLVSRLSLRMVTLSGDAARSVNVLANASADSSARVAVAGDLGARVSIISPVALSSDEK